MSNKFIRRRSFDDRYNYPWYYEHYLNGVVNDSGEGGMSTILGEAGTMEDVVTPHFHKRIANGEIINNPMRSTKETSTLRVDAEARSHYDNGAGLTASYNYLGSYAAAICGIQSFGHLGVNLSRELSTLAGTEAYANVNDPQFGGAVFLGELREALSLVNNPLKSLNKFLGKAQANFRRRKRNHTTTSGASNLQGFIADNWLVYQFGIKPTVNDLDDAMKVLTSTADIRLRYTAKGEASDSGFNTEDPIQRSAFHFWDIFVSRHTSTKREVKAGVLYEMERNLSKNRWGLSLQDLPDAVWETIPFSFIVDYIFNVGDYISAITPKIGVNYLASWTVQTTEKNTETSYEGQWRDGTHPAYQPDVAPSGARVHTTLEKVRSTSAAIGLAPKVAPFEGEYGQKRVLNSIALMQSILNSR